MTVQGKFIFNKLSSFYNWFIVLSLASMIPVGLYYYHEARNIGIEKAVNQLSQVEASTRKTAETPPEQIAAEFHMANIIQNLETKHHRSLSIEEKEQVRLYVENKYHVKLN